MALTKKKKTIKPTPLAVQLNGETGAVEAIIKGDERVFSIEDTQEIVTKGRSAQSHKDFAALGKMVYQTVDAQNKRKPEYTEE